MTRSRPQNSILAVATLGVYLGLILAGGAPSILAQAATAKQFNIKDEVEYTENLDRKPANAEAAADDKLNAKITSSVKRLISKVRASSAPAASVIVLDAPASIAPKFYTEPLRVHRTHSVPNSLSDIVGRQNLARAGIA